MSGNDLAAKVKEAAEIAKLVPENLQNSAFNRALDALLGSSSTEEAAPPGSRGAKKTNRKSPTPGTKTGSDEPNLMDHLDRTSHPEVFDAPRILEKSLFLLRAAHDDYEVDGLSASEIANILDKKFKIPATRQGVTQALNGPGKKLVNAKKDSSGVKYRLMAPGEKYLDEGAWQAATNGSTPAKRRSKSSTKKVKAKSPEKASQTPVRKRSRSSGSGDGTTKGRPGPTAALRGLLDKGFFGKPKPISDMISELSETTGYQFKANELSPSLLALLRNGTLSRKRNSNNQYEYRAS